MVEKTANDEELPLVYRLILKIPKISLDDVSMKISGLFWILILPIFMISEFLVNLLLLTCMSFPFNYASIIVFNSAIALLIIRVLVERTLNAEKALLSEGHFKWNVEEIFDSYLESLKRNEKEKSESESQ
jgi:hypothetical protein